MKKIIVGNLKMNLITLAERGTYFEDFKKELKGKDFSNSEIVLCPPSVHLESFVNVFKSTKVDIGAQNIFWEEKGSFTGEISASMVKNLGAEYVILGHSDRRRYFGETDESIKQKIASALRNDLKVVLCIGENGEEKKSGIGEQVVARQLEGCLKEVIEIDISKIIICYEPVWAISSNNPDHMTTTEEIITAKLVIKKFLANKFGAGVMEKVAVIYGGSVSADNVKQVCNDPGMDGALVGKESLAPREFVKIVEIINKK